MNEIDFNLPPNLNEALVSYYASQTPDPLFAANLERQLFQRQSELKPVRKGNHPFLRDFVKSYKLTFHSRPVLAILTALLALMILTGIVYAVSKLAGFIPGIGFVNEVQSVMETPVTVERPIASSATADPDADVISTSSVGELSSQTRNGITLTVEQAVSDADRLVINYKITGLPANFFGPEHNPPSSSDVQDDVIPEQVRLPDNSVLHFLDGSICEGSGDLTSSWISCHYMFSPLPQGINEFTLEIQRLYNALPGELPEDWKINIRMAPVSSDRTVSGVQEMDLRSQTIHGLTLQLLKVSQGASQTAFQLGMLLDLEDRYIQYMAPVTLQDERGRYYIISSGLDGGHYVGENTQSFIFQSMYTTPVDTSGPLTFSIEWEVISVNQPVYFTFDPGKNAGLGQEWSMDESFDIGGINLHLINARLKPGSDGDISLEFDFEAPEDVVMVHLFPKNQSSGSASSGYDRQHGVIVSRISLPAIPDQPVEFVISQVFYKISGPWQITWQPEQISFPAMATATPVPVRTAEAAPTLVPDEPLLVELQNLLAKNALTTPTGPGWVHQVIKIDQPPSVGDLELVNLPEQLQNYQRDNWYYLDDKGYVRKGVYINRKLDGSISSVVIHNGVYYFNIPQMFGSVGEEIYLDRPSFEGDVIFGMNSYVSQGGTIRREESVVDGIPCQLFEATLPVNPPQVYVNEALPISAMVTTACINPLNGQIIQSQSWSVYDNGKLSDESTSQYLLLEKVDVLPEDVQKILDSVIMP